MKKTNIGRGILILLLISICAFGFISARKADIVKSANTAYIAPEDMQQGSYYYYWDHGSGAMVAQFDSYDSNTQTIHNSYSITPLQSLFTQGGSISVYDAGNITFATLTQITHLLRCILAGIFVP